MSPRPVSPSQQRGYGVVRVCQEWGVRRSTYYHHQHHAARPPAEPAERPNQMWGTDATSTVTQQDGPLTVFVGIDHCTLEGIGIHAARRATRFEALEPIRQGVRQQFGTFSLGSATGVQVRHDHGSQYMSDNFQAELRFLGMTSSPAFVRAPEGNGVAEWFIRTLKEQLLWVRTFQTVEDLRLALHDWAFLSARTLTMSTTRSPTAELMSRSGFFSSSQIRRSASP
jgi:transposase InsO family protein